MGNLLKDKMTVVSMESGDLQVTVEEEFEDTLTYVVEIRPSEELIARRGWGSRIWFQIGGAHASMEERVDMKKVYEQKMFAEL